ncbi:hypothetical protein KUCAC02_017404, partial [Chaenocephalus aceratus]
LGISGGISVGEDRRAGEGCVRQGADEGLVTLIWGERNSPAEQVTFETWTLPQPVNASQSNKRQGHSHKAASSSLINEEDKRLTAGVSGGNNNHLESR